MNETQILIGDEPQVLHQAGAALGIDTRSRQTKTRDALQLAVDLANAEAKARPRGQSSPHGSMPAAISTPVAPEAQALPEVPSVGQTVTPRFGLQLPGVR